MRLKALIWFLLAQAPVSLAVIPEVMAAKPPARAVSSTDIAAWGFGLVVVLAVFLLCVWGLRKLSGFTAGGGGKLRLIGGLSLGMRERVVLLQAGKKQLILGVTPGRIETLLVLEGEDCLQKEEPLYTADSMESGFAQKLAQMLKTRPEQQRSE
jgi:flagellar protein FliO/FliZ